MKKTEYTVLGFPISKIPRYDKTPKEAFASIALALSIKLNRDHKIGGIGYLDKALRELEISLEEDWEK